MRNGSHLVDWFDGHVSLQFDLRGKLLLLTAPVPFDLRLAVEFDGDLVLELALVLLSAWHEVLRFVLHDVGNRLATSSQVLL